MTKMAAQRLSPGRRIVVAALLAAALATPGSADGVSRNYQVRDDDAARFALTQFRKHSDASSTDPKEWFAAIQELQKLLDLPAERGVVVAVPGSSPQRYENAWRVAVRLFESLPPPGRAMWEELERRPAEELLARGVRLRRDEDLVAAARRYPARDVRRRAHDALAHLAVARGDFDRAGRELESLLDVTEPDAQAAVFARLAFARAHQGDVEGTSRIAVLAKAHLGDAVRRASADPRTPETEPLSASLARMQEQAAGAARGFASARMFGGDRHGSGVSDAPPRAGSPGWSVATEFRRGDENDSGGNMGWPNDMRFNSGSQLDARFRPVVPTISHGSVFLNNGLDLRAYDIASGRETWRVDTQQREPVWRDSPNAYSAVTVSDGVVYAALATRTDAPEIDRRFYGAIIIYSLPHRSLHAVDARTGDVLWSHDPRRLGGRADADEIERESVATAPLVVGDDLIVMTWTYNTRYEARLVCFDRRTGATRWRTSLVHGQQEMNLFGRPVKELVAPPLAELDGLVYLSTGLGIAGAVDRVTGDIVWISEYETTSIPSTTLWHETKDRVVTWRPSPVTATRQAVVMAPLEASNLLGFDPKTGALLWQRPISTPSGNMQWFIGAQDGRAYALGGRLHAFDLATGRDAWATPEAGRLAPFGSPAAPALGRGVVAADGIYVPTSAGIVRLDAGTGSVAETRALPANPRDPRNVFRHDGNLVSADGALVVASNDRIDAYYSFEDVAARLNARLAAAPGDPALRLEAGEMFRAASRLDAAIECFDRGLEGAAASGARPGDHIAETQRDAACDAALARVVAEFGDVQTVVDDDVRVDVGALAAFRLGARRVDRGDLRGGVDSWMRLLDEHADAALGETNVTGAVRSALDDLVVKSGPEVAALVSARARASLDAARAAKDVVALHRISRTSPSNEVAIEASMEAARIHLAAGRTREAAAVLEGQVLRDQPPQPLARALWLLATAYRSLDETPRERSALRRIVQECPAASLDDGRAAGETARAKLQADRFRSTPTALPDPHPPVTVRWENLGGTDEPAIQLLQVQGTRPRAFEGRLLFLQEGVLKLLDVAESRHVWISEADVEVRATFGTSGSIVLVGDDARIRPRMVRLDGIAADDGRRTWTRRLAGKYAASASALGAVYVLRSDTNDKGERISWLTAVSADTGDVIAETRLGDKAQLQVSCAADAVLWSELIPQGNVARRRVHTLDGATLAPRGVVEIEGHSSPFALNPPGTSLVVTTSRHDGIVAIDASTGALAWPAVALRGRAVKNVMVVPGGVIVTDDGDNVRRFDALTGTETWVRPLGGDASLGFSGEAAEGDLVVATLIPQDTALMPIAVGLDAATGA
ncbi:MAG: PQQ-binding-like beta-propeller repeat protein, partial [Planctomycetes bacterium]|nr:PQQ-binding-like beta-propeller repeat protein [Planctomycetota bacterium]